MSMERCHYCGKLVDTDYDADGEYDSHLRYMCSRCVDREDAEDQEQTRAAHSHTGE
jgi:phage FluMu protein Com